MCCPLPPIWFRESCSNHMVIALFLEKSKGYSCLNIITMIIHSLMDHLKLVIIKLTKVDTTCGTGSFIITSFRWSIKLCIMVQFQNSLYYSTINYVPYKLHLVLLFCFNYFALNLWLMFDIFNTLCQSSVDK